MHMERGRGTKKSDKTSFWYQFVVMGLVLFFSYAVISLVAYVFGVFRHGVDIFNPESRDLDRLATYIWPFDQGLAEFADDAHQLLDAYLAEENIFQTQRERVDSVWKYIADNHKRLSSLGFSQYDDLFATIASLYPYRDEVYQLLGSEQSFTYLIALQNTGERRPNGGFFGSFVIMTIDKGKITTFQPVDSYFPDSIAPGVRIPGPVW
ncbi:MAG: DUF4012 domain-containing protein [Candidatus Peribacteria bacterium]|nr:MAG: DUF4012 domain-containing protein [Candidatus Peribacteria bacterium]